MRPRLLFTLLLFGAACDAPAEAAVPGGPPARANETPLSLGTRAEHVEPWAAALPPLELSNGTTRRTATVQLYTKAGEVDEGACEEFADVASPDGDLHPLAERLLELVVKAAVHFGAMHVDIVSGWRDRAGRHTAGEALDFRLTSVRAPLLASYLRGLARVGVGIYTHPRTQYVHLDVRDASYHWLDASPPAVSWRERAIPDAGAARRDAAWTPESDLPLP